MKQRIKRLAIMTSLFGILLLSLANNAHATSGFLKAASIKTCPNGSTYGYHGSDNHWHAAIRSESDGRWRASGNPLSGDPCPSSNASGGNSSNNSSRPSSPSGSSSSSNSNPSSGSNSTSNNGTSLSLNNSSNNSSSNNNSSTGQSAESKEIVKSSDTSIKALRINGYEVSLFASPLYYALAAESLDSIDIQLNDSKATYSLSDYDSNFADKESAQKIAITVTAEDGSIEKYTLDVVKKVPSVGLNVWTKEGANQIKIQDSSKEHILDNVEFWQSSQCFIYEPINDTTNIEITSNGNVVTDCAPLNVGDNHIVFKVSNKYGDEEEFTISVHRNDILTTVIADIFAGITIITFFAAIGYLIKYYLLHKQCECKQKKTIKQKKANLKDLAIKTYIPPYIIIKNKITHKKSSKWLIGWLVLWSLLVVSIIGAVFGNTTEISRNLSDYNKDTSYYSFLVKYPDAPVVNDSQNDADQEKTEQQDEDKTTSNNGTKENNSSSTNNSSNNSNQNTSSTASPSKSDPMSGIRIAEATSVPYSRNEYQPNWGAGSGCNIRARILQTTSLIDFRTSNGCTVTYGSWYDVYTGKTLTGNPYRGDGTENDLDIDHIIPLNYVNSHGGYNWSSSQKRAYGASLTGMNNGVYLAVSASENRKKSDKGPSEYYPPNSAYRCTYAQKWRDVARIYSIALSNADYVVVKNVLETCGIE